MPVKQKVSLERNSSSRAKNIVDSVSGFGFDPWSGGTDMRAIVISAALAISGCAVPGQKQLDDVTAKCIAGNSFACSLVPYAQQEVEREHEARREAAQNAAAVLAITGAAMSAAAAAMPQRPQPAPPTVTMCHQMGSFTQCTTN